METVFLLDGNFSHHGLRGSVSSFPGRQIVPKRIDWNRINPQDLSAPIVTQSDKKIVYSDGFLSQAPEPLKSRNVAWLIEPRALIPSTYSEFVLNHHFKNFSLVLTHDSALRHLIEMECSENGFDVPEIKDYVFGGAWVGENEIGHYPKSKDVCIIASSKTQLPGHKLRHEIISSLGETFSLDVFGSGYKPFGGMADVLKDYRFCIVVENVKDGNWMTEKLFTPILLGCDVIYYGSENIPFQVREFDSVSDLKTILQNLKSDGYHKSYADRFEYINRVMFKTAKRFMICEDAFPL